MNKRYNIFIISRLYLKRYYKFLVNETTVRKSDDAQKLFLYSMKKIYGLDTTEFGDVISKYSDKCIEYLKDTPNTPKDKSRVSFEDRVRIVSVCEGYIYASGLLTYKSIQGGRIRKE